MGDTSTAAAAAPTDPTDNTGAAPAAGAPKNPEYFEVNPNRQYFFGIDISGSMRTRDAILEGKTRYEFSLAKAKDFIQTAEKFDPDGPTVLLFNDSVQVFENTTLAAVDAKLSGITPSGSTDTASLVTTAYALHKKAAAGKSVLLIVTDGEPNSEPALFKAIADITNDVKEDDDFSLSFLTVGDIAPDGALRAFLDKLDDDLPGAKYDIVDVKRLEDVSLFQAVEGAVAD